MLGFAPLSARPISGGPFSLILVAAAISATGTLTFSGSAQWGSFQAISATGTLRFSGSAVWTTLNALSSTDTLVFGGHAILRIAGRPIVFVAVPDRHEFIATPERMTFTSKPDNFTFKGMR